MAPLIEATEKSFFLIQVGSDMLHVLVELTTSSPRPAAAQLRDRNGNLLQDQGGMIEASGRAGDARGLLMLWQLTCRTCKRGRRQRLRLCE